MDSAPSPKKGHCELAAPTLKIYHIHESSHHKVSAVTGSGRHVTSKNEPSHSTSSTSNSHQEKKASGLNTTDISYRKVDLLSQTKNKDIENSPPQTPDQFKDLNTSILMLAPLARDIEQAVKGNLTPEQPLDNISSFNIGQVFQREFEKELKKQLPPNDRYFRLNSKFKNKILAFKKEAALHLSSTGLKGIIESADNPESFLPKLSIVNPHNNPFNQRLSDTTVKYLLDELSKKSKLQKCRDLKKITFYLSKKNIRK